MEKWKYRVFASHLDPAELVFILDQSGSEGWELVAVVPVVDYHALEVLDPTGTKGKKTSSKTTDDLLPTEAFRYIFKQPLT